MSKDEVFPNILFVYESNPEYTNFYLIPSDAEMSVNLRKAVIGINGLMVNTSDVDNDSKLWKHWAYVNAAITKDRDHLDEDNRFDENRFFGMLTKFQIEEANIGEKTIIGIEGPLLLVRAGIIM